MSRTLPIAALVAALVVAGALWGAGAGPGADRPTDADPTPGASAAPTEVVLGTAPFELLSATVEPVEPFVMRRGPEAGLLVDRRLVIGGRGFYGTALGPWVTFDGVEVDGVELRGDQRITVYLTEARVGPVEVGVALPDGRSAAIVAEL